MESNSSIQFLVFLPEREHEHHIAHVIHGSAARSTILYLQPIQIPGSRCLGSSQLFCLSFVRLQCLNRQPLPSVVFSSVDLGYKNSESLSRNALLSWCRIVSFPCASKYWRCAHRCSLGIQVSLAQDQLIFAPWKPENQGHFCRRCFEDIGTGLKVKGGRAIPCLVTTDFLGLLDPSRISMSSGSNSRGFPLPGLERVFFR